MITTTHWLGATCWALSILAQAAPAQRTSGAAPAALPGAAVRPITAAEFPDTSSLRTAVDAFCGSAVPPAENRANVRRVAKDLRWFKTLRAGLREAERRERPLLWIQAYGALDGFA